MPQMPAVLPNVPPSTPKTHPSGSSDNNGQSGFSPHLDRAVSGKHKEQRIPPGKTAPEKSCDTEQKNLATTLETTDNSSETVAFPTRESSTEIADENTEQAFFLPTVPGNIPQTSPFYLTQLQPTELQTSQPNNMAVDIAGRVSSSLIISSEIQTQVAEDVSSGQQIQAVAEKQDALMSQLHNIIASSSDTEAVLAPKAESPAITISVDTNFYSSLNAALTGKMEASSMSASTQTAESKQNGLLLADGDSLTFTPGKSMDQLPGTRHDGQQPQLATKINVEIIADNGQNFQDSQPEGDLARQATGTSLANSLFSTTDQPSTFSTMATMAQDLNIQTTTESAKPIVLPSGIVVHEHEVLQQLTEKFHLSGKNIDSRINLTLHPAELGELKIDLTLKEGAIRASIVAQSQHTLEILEKNLPKLKTMLENQGLDIDQIELAAESDSVTDFDLFDRQLFGNNDQHPATRKGRRKEDGEFTLDDIPFTAPAANSGVNVKI